MAHEISFKTKSRDAAMTIASDLHSQGHDVAAWSDTKGKYYVLDGKPMVEGVPEGGLLLEYEPAKGIPVMTEAYRGPDRRRTPRVDARFPMQVTRLGKVGRA